MNRLQKEAVWKIQDKFRGDQDPSVLDYVDDVYVARHEFEIWESESDRVVRVDCLERDEHSVGVRTASFIVGPRGAIREL